MRTASAEAVFLCRTFGDEAWSQQVAPSCVARAARSAARLMSRQRLYVCPYMTSPPPLDVQLVLELKLGKLVAEISHILPSCRRNVLTLLVDEHLADTARQAEAYSVLRFWSQPREAWVAMGEAPSKDR
jgi:hypothetical protein